MITEGDAAIPLETTRRAFRNQEKSKQRSAIVINKSKKILAHLIIYTYLKKAELRDVMFQIILTEFRHFVVYLQKI